MSIIHDALKKVQQRLVPKTDKPLVSPSTVSQIASAYLHETPPKIETLPRAGQQTISRHSPMKNKIKSVFVLSCAMVITAASILYIFQQFQTNVPKVQNFAKKSFYKLIHKKEQPAKTTENLKPLAQFTINPPTATGSSTAQAAAPVTLNVHGIMSNGAGNLALINDQVYQPGDEIDGAKIVKIDLNSITVNINGTEKTIFVKD